MGSVCDRVASLDDNLINYLVSTLLCASATRCNSTETYKERKETFKLFSEIILLSLTICSK